MHVLVAKPKRLETLATFPGCWPTLIFSRFVKISTLSSLDSLSCCFGLFVFSAACLAESLVRSWFRNMAGCMIQKALDRRQAAWWNTRSLCNRRALASVIMIHTVHGSYWPLLCCITAWYPCPLHQCGQTYSYMDMQALVDTPRLDS